MADTANRVEAKAPAFGTLAPVIQTDDMGGDAKCLGHRTIGGMSLRTYLAAKAMQGLLADSSVSRGRGDASGTWPLDVDEFNKAVAKCAVRKADALIHALNTTEPK